MFSCPELIPICIFFPHPPAFERTDHRLSTRSRSRTSSGHGSTNSEWPGDMVLHHAQIITKFSRIIFEKLLSEDISIPLFIHGRRSLLLRWEVVPDTDGHRIFCCCHETGLTVTLSFFSSDTWFPKQLGKWLHWRTSFLHHCPMFVFPEEFQSVLNVHWRTEVTYLQLVLTTDHYPKVSSCWASFALVVCESLKETKVQTEPSFHEMNLKLKMSFRVMVGPQSQTTGLNKFFFITVKPLDMTWLYYL